MFFSHQNIVKKLEHHVFWARSRKYFCLVLEFIDGPDLYDLTRNCEISCAIVRKIALQLCQTMKFVHLKGWYHMDLKAANVMVRDCSLVRHTSFEF